MRRIFVSIVVVVLILLFLLVALFFAAFGGFNFLIDVPEPEIKYGEFPCKLTYELDGDIIEITDTIICEFDGYEVVGESGKYRKWKSSLKSGNEELTLLDLRDKRIINELDQIMLEFFFYWGNAEYYMGDIENGRDRGAQDFDWVEYKYQTQDGKAGGSAYPMKEAYEKYKIRLISWEVVPPIENKFE